MAKTPPVPGLTPADLQAIAAGGKSKTKLSYAQLRSLWIGAGGSPALASQMAAVALAESNGNPQDPWRIGFYQGQRGGKTKTYPNVQQAAAAAVQASAQAGPQFWPTYSSGAFTAFYRAVTPQEKTQAKVGQATADAGSPTLAQQKAQVAISTAAAKATAHVGDPWVTVERDAKGNVTGFGEAMGVTPPANALMIGGQAATKSVYQGIWGANYENIYESFTGQQPTPAQIAQTLASGTSTYTLKTQLAAQPAFTSSPIYKANAASITDRAKQLLGTHAPPTFIRDALAQGWDASQIDAQLKALPAYKTGPVFKSDLASARNIYESVFGHAPPKSELPWLENAVTKGWSGDLIQQRLRSEPAFKQSHPGFDQGIKQGLFADEAGYRHYSGQINQVYNQYHGADAHPAEVAHYIQQGVTPTVLGQQFQGKSYISANKNDIQYALSTMGPGAAGPKQLTALGREKAGLDTPLGQQVQTAYEKALTRLHGAFQGVLASPALSLAGGRLQGAARPPDTGV